MLKLREIQDITQIMLGREVNGTVFYWTTAYLIDGLLIDTGCSYTADELAQHLQDKKVDTIINTHHHEDHVGGNALIQKKFTKDIAAHSKAIPLINQRPFLHQYQEMVWGYPEPTTVTPIPPVIKTPHYYFQVLETPGHCPDHISLFEPNQGWLFSGDLFVSENQKVFRVDEDIFTIQNTLQNILTLPSEEIILFTSIGKIFPQGRSAITTFLTYINELHHKATELSRNGLTPEQIMEFIFGRESSLTALTGAHYSSYNLIKKLLDGP